MAEFDPNSFLEQEKSSEFNPDSFLEQEGVKKKESTELSSGLPQYVAAPKSTSESGSGVLDGIEPSMDNLRVMDNYVTPSGKTPQTETPQQKSERLNSALTPNAKAQKNYIVAKTKYDELISNHSANPIEVDQIAKQVDYFQSRLEKPQTKENDIADEVASILYSFNKSVSDNVVTPIAGAINLMEDLESGGGIFKKPNRTLSKTVGDVSKYYDKVSEENQPQTIVGKTAAATASAIPLIALTTMTGAGTLPFVIGGQKALTEYGNEPNKPMSLKAEEATEALGEGIKEGLEIEASMMVGGAFGKAVSQELNLGKWGSATARGVGVGAAFALPDFAKVAVENKSLDAPDKEETFVSFATGLAFEAPKFFGLIKNAVSENKVERAAKIQNLDIYNTVFSAPLEAVSEAVEIPQSSELIYKRASSFLKKENPTNEDKIAFQALTRTAGVKDLVDVIISNPEKAKEQISSSDLTPEQKSEFRKRITEINQYFNPIEVRKTELSDEIELAQKTLSDLPEPQTPIDRAENAVLTEKLQETIKKSEQELTDLVRGQIDEAMNPKVEKDGNINLEQQVEPAPPVKVEGVGDGAEAEATKESELKKLEDELAINLAKAEKESDAKPIIKTKRADGTIDTNSIRENAIQAANSLYEYGVKRVNEKYAAQEVKPKTESPESGSVGVELEAKKADIERRRKEELFDILSEEDKQIALKIPEGDKRNKWVKTRVSKTTKGNDAIERHNAEDALNTSTDVATRIAAKRKLESNQPFNAGSISDINNVIFKIKNDDVLIGSEKLIKDYYDAELKALEQKQSTETKVEASNTSNVEEGSVGVGGDVESTTNVFNETQKSNPTVWQKIKDAFYHVVGKVHEGFKNTQDFIDNAINGDTQFSELAKALKDKLGDIKTSFVDDLRNKEGKLAYGKHNKDGITVSRKSPHPLQTWFHEAVHKLTVDKLYDYEEGNLHKLSDKDIEAIQNLHRIFGNVQKILNDKGIETKQHNPFKNVREFVAEALTNPEFQEILNKFKGEGKSPTLLKQFLDAVSKLLGLKDGSILDDVFHHTENLFNEGKSEQKNIAEAYHDAKSKGIENDFTKAVEQSLKETTKAETPTTNTGVEEGSGGVGGDVVGKTFRDNYNRTFEVKGENAGILTLEDVDTGKVLRKKKSEVLSDFKEITEPDVVDKTKTITEHLPKGGELKGVTEIDVSENGEEVSYGTKTRKTSITVKGLSAEEIKQEIKFEKQVLERSKRDAANFNEDEIRSAKGMTRQEKEDAIKMHKQSLINNEQVEKIVIPFYEKHLEIAEQSLKETPKAETTTTTSNVGVEEGSGGVGGDAPLKENEYYHATDNNEILAPSDKGYKKREGNNVVGEGIYFGKDKEHLTDRYGENIIKVELDIKNPLVSDNKYIVVDGREIDVQSLSKDDINFLKEKGYDAIKYVAADKAYSKFNETIVFDKSQIKKSEQSIKETTQSETKVAEKGVEEPITEEIKTAIDNGEITREQVDGFIEQDESVITDIERKAESENEAELNSAIDQADKLIGEAVGATEGEKQPTDKGTSEDKVTGIKKAMVEKDRADAGLPPIELPKSNKPQEQLERAKELVDSGEVDPSELEAYLISHAENPSDAKTSEADQYILQYQRMKIEARSKEILTERMAIEDRLKEDPTDVQANLDLASNEIARQQNIYDLDRNTTASRVTSNIWGKLGNAKQQVINERGIVQQQIQRIKELHGDNMPKDVQLKLDKLEKQVNELNTRISTLEESITKNIAQQNINKETRRPLIKRTGRRSTEVINAEIKDKLSTIANKIAERIEKSAVKNFAANKEQSKSLIADIAPDVMDVVKLVSEKTGNKLEDVVNKTYDTIKDIAEGIGKRDIVDIIAGKYSDKKPLSELQKQINDIRSQARLNERIDELEKGILRETQKRGESSEEVKKLRERANELMKKSKNDLANFSANELKKQVEQLQKKIDKGEFLPQKTVKKAFEQDANWVKYSQEKKKLKQELNHLEAQALYDKKNLYMKTLDQFNKFSRLGLFIFSTAYQLKLAAAALSTIAHKPIEDLVGTAIKPMVKEIADRAPIEGRNINAEATAEFYKNLSPIKILRGAYQILSKGESDLSRELSSHPKKEGNIFNPLSDHSVLNWIADDPHKIIKNPIKQGIFDASLANYMNYYASKGMDINDPILIEKARQASYMRAEYEIFMGGENSKTAVSEWFKKMESEGILDAQSESFKTKVGGNLKYSISALKNFIVPIASVPANILNRTVKNNPISTAYRFSEALKTNSELKNNVTETLDNLTEAQADLMLRDLKKGAIGSVYWTLGFIMAGNALGGFFNKSYPDKKRDKDEKGHDEMEIFGKNIPHGVQHAVPLQQMQMAATFALTLKYFNEQDKKKLKDDFGLKDEIKNVGAGGAEIARTYINEHPMSKASLDIVKALEGGKGREKYFNSLERRSDIPQTKFLLQDIGLIEKDDSYEKQKAKSKKHNEVKDLYDVFWYMMDDKKFENHNE